MKGSHIALLVIGVLLFLAGVTFTLQGYGVLGPSGGLMYENRTWVYAGSLILALGLVFVYAALFLSRRAPATVSAHLQTASRRAAPCVSCIRL